MKNKNEIQVLRLKFLKKSISEMKNITQITKNQVPEAKNDYQRIRKTKDSWHTINPIPASEIINNLPLVISSLKPHERDLLNLILWNTKHHPHLYIKQETLGDYVGVTRQTINKVLRKFEEIGFIASNYRHLKSSLYKASSIFYHPEIRRQLSSLLTALRTISVLAIITAAQLYGYNLSQQELNNDKRLRLLFNMGLITQTKRGLEVYIPTYQVTICKRDGRQVNQYIRDQEPTRRYLKSGDVMKDNPISQEIRTINHMPLSRWGQIRLSAFPDEAIKYAKDCVKYATQVRDPFAWFFYMCVEWCRDNNIQPDWEHVRCLGQAFNMPPNPRVLLGNQEPSGFTSTCVFDGDTHNETVVVFNKPKQNSMAHASKNRTPQKGSMKNFRPISTPTIPPEKIAEFMKLKDKDHTTMTPMEMFEFWMEHKAESDAFFGKPPIPTLPRDKRPMFNHVASIFKAKL